MGLPIFVFSLITEGTTEKVLQFKKSLKPIYNKNFGFIEHYREVQTIKNLLIDIILPWKFFSEDLSELLPMRLG